MNQTHDNTHNPKNKAEHTVFLLSRRPQFGGSARDSDGGRIAQFGFQVSENEDDGQMRRVTQ